MHIIKRNPLLYIVLVLLLLLAGDESGSGHNPPLLRSACLTTINNNVSTPGDSLGENMTLTDNSPTIRMEFATNITDQTVWDNNKNNIKLYDGNDKIVTADVSRIDPNIALQNEIIFLSSNCRH